MIISKLGNFIKEEELSDKKLSKNRNFHFRKCTYTLYSCSYMNFRVTQNVIYIRNITNYDIHVFDRYNTSLKSPMVIPL